MAGVRLRGSTSNVEGIGALFGFTPAAVAMPSDAHYTLTADEYKCPILVVSSVSLSGTKNVVAPLKNGALLIVVNSTTGGQSIQVIGASGTGVTIANGKTAILRCDGVNWIRVTADNP